MGFLSLSILLILVIFGVIFISLIIWRLLHRTSKNRQSKIKDTPLENTPENRLTITDSNWSSRPKEIQIRICPTCKRTYPDLMTSFCLEDGKPLLITAVTLPPEPEKTVTFGKNK